MPDAGTVFLHCVGYGTCNSKYFPKAEPGLFGYLLDAKSGKTIAVMKGNSRARYDAYRVSKDGRRILGFGAGSSPVAFDTRTGILQYTTWLNTAASPSSAETYVDWAEFSPNGKWIVACVNTRITLINAASGHVDGVLDALYHGTISRTTPPVVFSNDGRYFLTNGNVWKLPK